MAATRHHNSTTLPIPEPQIAYSVIFDSPSEIKKGNVHPNGCRIILYTLVIGSSTSSSHWQLCRRQRNTRIRALVWAHVDKLTIDGIHLGAMTKFVAQDIFLPGTRRIRTSLATMSRLVRSVKNTAALKIDTEGHDFKVLSGALRMIRSGKIKAIFMEMHHGVRHTFMQKKSKIATKTCCFQKHVAMSYTRITSSCSFRRAVLLQTCESLLVLW